MNMLTLLVMSLFSNMWFIYPVYTLFLLSREMNLTSVLTLESILALGILLWEVPSSLLADRWGRKQMIVLARLLGVLEAVPMLWARGFWAFAGLYFLSGLAIASQSGTLEAYIYETLGDRREMTRRLGAIHATQSAGMVIGSLIGGWVVARLGEQGYLTCLGLSILATIPALIAALRLPRDVPVAAQEHASMLEILQSGTRAVFRSGLVLILVLLLFNLPGNVETHYLWQPYLKGLGMDIGRFGLVAVGVNLAGMLGSLLASWLSRIRLVGQTIPPRRIVLLGGVLCLGLLVMVIGSHQAAWGLAALLGLFLMNALLDPILITQLNNHFPDQARATALSGVSWVSSTTRMVIRPGIGYLADLNITYPFRWDLIAMGVSLLAAAMVKRSISQPVDQKPLHRGAGS